MRELLVPGVAFGAVAVEARVVDVAVDDEGVASDSTAVRGGGEGEHFLSVAVVGVAAVVAEFEVVVGADVHQAADGLLRILLSTRPAVAVDVRGLSGHVRRSWRPGICFAVGARGVKTCDWACKKRDIRRAVH